MTHEHIKRGMMQAAEIWGWGSWTFAEALMSETFGFCSSQEVLKAISDRCKTPHKFQRIWENPTEAEYVQIVRKAFQYADDDVDELDWGSETIKRPWRVAA